MIVSKKTAREEGEESRREDLGVNMMMEPPASPKATLNQVHSEPQSPDTPGRSSQALSGARSSKGESIRRSSGNIAVFGVKGQTSVQSPQERRLSQPSHQERRLSNSTEQSSLPERRLSHSTQKSLLERRLSHSSRPSPPLSEHEEDHPIKQAPRRSTVQNLLAFQEEHAAGQGFGIARRQSRSQPKSPSQPRSPPQRTDVELAAELKDIRMTMGKLLLRMDQSGSGQLDDAHLSTEKRIIRRCHHCDCCHRSLMEGFHAPKEKMNLRKFGTLRAPNAARSHRTW